MLKDEETLGSLGFSGKKGSLYFKDLGPQIGWTTVCIAFSCTLLCLYKDVYWR